MRWTYVALAVGLVGGGLALNLAQSQTPQVSVVGAVTSGHCVSFASTLQLQDAGSPCSGGGGGGAITGNPIYGGTTPNVAMIVQSTSNGAPSGDSMTLNATGGVSIGAFGASIVNGLQLNTAATGVAPSVAAFGSDSNIGLSFNAKGTGVFTWFTHALAGTEFQVNNSSTADVNFVAATGAATGNAPSLAATGTDTNVSLQLNTKGSGTINGSVFNANTGFQVAGGAAANHVLIGNGTDYVDSTLSGLLDTLGSVQGDILYRGASTWTVLAPGANGTVLTSGGASANPSWTAGTTLHVPQITVLSSGSGTYTTPTNPSPLYLVVEMAGGGGGGGGSGTSGSGGTASSGGTTTFGSSFLTANGGGAGVGGASYGSGAGSVGASGGTASGGDFNATGGDGGAADSVGSGLGPESAGTGGASCFGGGGSGGSILAAAGVGAVGNNGKAYGSGGGGAAGSSGATVSNGTGGGAGGCLRKAITSSIAATYSYAVGGAGGGGAAGTSGHAGGNGVAGLIIVTAYFQ